MLHSVRCVTYNGGFQIKQIFQGLLKPLMPVDCANHGIGFVNNQNPITSFVVLSVFLDCCVPPKRARRSSFLVNSELQHVPKAFTRVLTFACFGDLRRRVRNYQSAPVRGAFKSFSDFGVLHFISHAIIFARRLKSNKEVGLTTALRLHAPCKRRRHSPTTTCFSFTAVPVDRCASFPCRSMLSSTP